MTTNIKITIFLFLAAMIFSASCEKTEYSLGELKAPSALTVSTTIIGVDAENPEGNGKGEVFVSLTAMDNISYSIDFGDGNKPLILHSDTITYKYSKPGTHEYTIIVKAIGDGGSISTVSANVRVFVSFTIPEDILEALTGTGSKVWVIEKSAYGHFGMGPNFGAAANPLDHYWPGWWQIDQNDAGQINEKSPAYDDEVTFERDNEDNVFMTVDNKGESYVLGVCLSYYGFSGDEGGYPVDTEGTKKLTFSGATSITTSEISTRVQFVVPGNGIICWGAASNTYEILSISSTNMYLHTTGSVNGNAWFQKFVPKQ